VNFRMGPISSARTPHCWPLGIPCQFPRHLAPACILTLKNLLFYRNADFEHGNGQA
jgi:hypothetical protein